MTDWNDAPDPEYYEFTPLFREYLEQSRTVVLRALDALNRKGGMLACHGIQHRITFCNLTFADLPEGQTDFDQTTEGAARGLPCLVLDFDPREDDQVRLAASLLPEAS